MNRLYTRRMLINRMEEVFNNFPQEKDYTINEYGLFFGKNTIDGQGGAVIGSEIIFTSENVAPFVKMNIKQDTITTVNYYLLRVQ